jgi:hypothetical protein
MSLNAMKVVDCFRCHWLLGKVVVAVTGCYWKSRVGSYGSHWLLWKVNCHSWSHRFIWHLLLCKSLVVKQVNDCYVKSMCAKEVTRWIHIRKIHSPLQVSMTFHGWRPFSLNAIILSNIEGVNKTMFHAKYLRCSSCKCLIYTYEENILPSRIWVNLDQRLSWE